MGLMIIDESNYLVEKDKVIETITNLFIFTDKKNWNKVKDCFIEKVFFDMSSLGGAASVLSSQQIVDSWNQGLAPIEAIHHQAGNYKVELNENGAAAFCYGVAYHYLKTKSGNNTRTFVGSYDFHLTKINNNC